MGLEGTQACPCKRLLHQTLPLVPPAGGHQPGHQCRPMTCLTAPMPVPMLHPYRPVMHPEAPKAYNYLHRSLHHTPQCNAHLRRSRAFTRPNEHQKVPWCKMGPLMAHRGSRHWCSRGRTQAVPEPRPTCAQATPKTGTAAPAAGAGMHAWCRKGAALQGLGAPRRKRRSQSG